LSEGEDGWWPVSGLEVGEVDGEDISVGVNRRPVNGDGLSLDDSGVKGWGQHLVGGDGNSKQRSCGEKSELHYELDFKECKLAEPSKRT